MYFWLLLQIYPCYLWLVLWSRSQICVCVCVYIYIYIYIYIKLIFMSITLVQLNHLSLIHVSEELSSQLSSEPPAPAVDLHPPPLSNSYHHTPTVPSYRLLEATVCQTPPQSLEDLHTCQSPILEHDPAPIQNSPWMESSLDQPYQKNKKSRSSSIKSRYIYLFYSLHFLQCKGSIKCQTHVIYDLCKAVLTHLVIKTSHSNFLGGYNHTSFSVMAIKPNMSTLIYVLLSAEHVIAKLQLYCFGFVFISGKKKCFCVSMYSSPAVTPTLPRLEVCLAEAGIPLQTPTYATLKYTQSCSAPSTPEMHLRRIQSLRFDLTLLTNTTIRKFAVGTNPFYIYMNIF